MQTNANLPATVTSEPEMQVAINHTEALQLYASASTLQLQPEENTKLLATFTDDLIEIRPDGHLYLPQSYYRNRLNEAVGIGQWSLVPKGFSEVTENGKTRMMLNGVLVIRGCFVAEAIGEAQQHSNNENQSKATVWEAAKSDCITRCCKDLSIAQQIYQPAFVKRWKDEFAVQVWVEGQTKPQWRKKNAEPLYKEKGPVAAGNAFPFMHPDKTKPWLNMKTRTGGITAEWQVIIDKIKAKTTDLNAIQQEFKISKEVGDVLATLFTQAAETGQTNAPAAKEDKDKVWLNKCTRNGYFTTEWLNIITKLKSKAVNLAAVTNHYKVNKENLAELELVVAQIAAGQLDPNFDINASVWDKLKACKFQEEVDALGKVFRPEIFQWGDWKTKFTNTKGSLPAKAKVA